MTQESGIDALIQQWAAERDQLPEDREAALIASAWLAEAPQFSRPAFSGPALAGIPGQRARTGASSFSPVEYADADFITAMRTRLPEVPHELLVAAAGCWQMVGDISEAEQWWDAGMSPLDQRALDYRAAGLAPSDLARRLGPMTVLQHLRRGSAAAWCVARLARQQKAS
jgi:hypothetical protein